MKEEPYIPSYIQFMLWIPNVYLLNFPHDKLDLPYARVLLHQEEVNLQRGESLLQIMEDRYKTTKKITSFDANPNLLNGCGNSENHEFVDPLLFLAPIEDMNEKLVT